MNGHIVLMLFILFYKKEKVESKKQLKHNNNKCMFLIEISFFFRILKFVIIYRRALGGRRSNFSLRGATNKIPRKARS